MTEVNKKHKISDTKSVEIKKQPKPRSTWMKDGFRYVESLTPGELCTMFPHMVFCDPGMFLREHYLFRLLLTIG